MKLKDFIKTVLIDIEEGIKESSQKTNRNIFLNSLDQKGDNGVEFDVAVTAGSEASGRVGAEVFSVGAKGEGKISSEEVSRIKFRIIVGNYIRR